MVNSSSFGSERNGNSQASCIQASSLHNKTQSLSPITASSATHLKNVFAGTAHSNQLCKSHAVEPTPSQTTDVEDLCKSATYDHESLLPPAALNNMEPDESKRSLFCSVPLEKVQTVLSKYTAFKYEGTKVKTPRKVLCLYCDRTFVNVNLRQKHVERCHSSKQLRRVSLRKNQTLLTSTPCVYCDKFTTAEHTLKDLFKHLIDNHFNKYFGCLACEDRFLNASHLTEHNLVVHNISPPKPETAVSTVVSNETAPNVEVTGIAGEVPAKTTRKKQTVEDEPKKSSGVNKNVRNKKLGVKSSKIILKRSKRLQAKLNNTYKKKRSKEVNDRKKNDKQEQTFAQEKSAKTSSSFINPYPEFDHFFQVKKITDHSIDNLKISSLTFDDVFDKAFFNRIKCNIQENLLHHIDGKLFKNEESESRISNFEKHSNIPPDTQNLNTENFGCELSLNAIAPTTMLLSSQFGDDPESQIEYGSKPSKKKAPIKKDEVHYKYFTRRKYQASILEHKENRDLSKLDMWTQYVIKNRQQKVLDDKKSPKEILDYFSGEEYKSVMKREELNRILDRRGPFEDLREEVSKRAALDKLNGDSNPVEDDNFTEIGELLNEILNKVFEISKNARVPAQTCAREIPSYLNLRPVTGLTSESEIDKSDKIALICSSQETENFELPSNTVRGKNEKVELTGEWARSRIYVCAACGLKLQNMKQFLEHKSASHQYIWIQHYEFVGNQNELYRHLSIPVLGKVGVLENTLQCKLWKRSDARLCTKCGKQCNSLGELHRHILECGGDWTWMLARKKCKYRPFGAKSRRKRRGLVKRIYNQKTEPSEKKVYKKNFDIPRQKPSDADTIKRMLANLPAKRATRKIMCLKDGFNTPRTKKINTTKQSKFKCGKLISANSKEAKKIASSKATTNKNQTANSRRSLRCKNKILTNNSSVIIRRKPSRKINVEDSANKEPHVDVVVPAEEEQVEVKAPPKKNTKANNSAIETEEVQTKRCSPRIEKRLEFNGAIDKMNIKRFFPVKKKTDADPAKNVVKKTAKPETEKVQNARKRKIDQTTSKNKPKVARTNSNSRKLRNSIQTAIIPKTKSKSDSCTQTDLLYFLEKPAPKNSDLADAPDLEVSQCENEKSLQTDEAYFEKTAESTAPTSVIAPEKSKRKCRKPLRGLNDCIAMLTSKLGEGFENTSNSVFQENVNDEDANKHEPTDDFILKVPFSNEHFDLHSTSKESKCLDEIIDSGNKKNAVFTPQGDMFNNVNDKFEPSASVYDESFEHALNESVVDDMIVEDNSTKNESNNSKDDVCCNESRETRDVLSVTEVFTNDSDSKKNYVSDSDDEIPLSTFLKDELYNDSLVITSRSDEETEMVESEADNSRMSLLNSSDNFIEQIQSQCDDLESHEVFSCNKQPESDDSLTAISTIASEQDQSASNHNSKTSPQDSGGMDLEEAPLTSFDYSSLNMVSDAETIDICREPANVVEDIKMGCDETEMKTRQSPVKEKPSKQFQVDEESNQESTKENIIEERVSNRKSPRNLKTKNSECLFDDALLEITDNAIAASAVESVAEEGEKSVEAAEEGKNKSLGEEADSNSLKELRRSRRNSKRVTSYNEIDLVDPLLDDVENDKTISRILRETTRDMFPIKRKSRKLLQQKKVAKNNGHSEKKLNGDELFDLLKTTAEGSKPTNSFFGNLDEISNDFHEDNFDVFGDILEKSMAALEDNLSERVMPTLQAEITKTEQPKPKKKVTKKTKKSKSKSSTNPDVNNLISGSDADIMSNLESTDTGELSQTDLVVRNIEAERSKMIYCDICEKSFSRVESLTKHKRTLTHISKLSEIEAREAALKAKSEEADVTEASSDDSGKNLNLLDMLGNIDTEDCKQYSTPFSVAVNNSNLKLADIINDVLNKPMLKKDGDSHNFQEIIISETEVQAEKRRYKSLAERKSFETENSVKNVDYFESSDISNATPGTILEKQITLLENMIENRSALNYMDELSVSSSSSSNRESSKDVDIDLKPESTKIEISEAKPREESFLKPTQYEEISEDSNLRNYEEQKSRKALNRDEELFLECCSLLKSSSEISNYSKKSKMTDLKLKQCEERDWLMNNCLTQKTNAELVECFSDSSRIRTPLGDSFSQEDSNSATISSNWGMNSMNTYSSLSKQNFSFEEVFCTNQRQSDIFSSNDKTIKEVQNVVSSFDHVVSELGENLDQRASTESDKDGKKMLTKGAMKVFETLKVSIPTEELSIDKILTSKSSTLEEDIKNKKSKARARRCNKNNRNKSSMSISSKNHDIYDFEETQDNSDIFTRPDFRTFRTTNDKKTDKLEDSDDDSVDNISLDAVSSSTSSVSELLPAESQTQENLTKKKNMICRIFKNAAKSRTSDEDIRSIPILDNAKLVEDFVLNCPEPIDEKKSKMTEEEMNLAFDNLINSKSNECNKATARPERRSNPCKKRAKVKSKKRSHPTSDSSDDEFKLEKSARKRTKKRNSKSEDGCINLEQELKECIGVASRKSQRKCTSGKQNVLIEYWSSDESSFETKLEMQTAQAVPPILVPETKQPEAELSRIRKTVIENGDRIGEVFVKKTRMSPPPISSNRRKRSAANPLYHWSSSSEDESRDLIEVRPIRDELEDEEDRPIQHGWIVGDSPKKLVTMLAQAKGKKCEGESVKEHGKKRTSTFS